MTEHSEHQTLKTNEIPCQETSDPAVLSKNPLVSVHMITYNHELYIAQAIEGVVMQETDFPVELIIGEDCSTDRTREIVLDYQKKYPEIIRVITSDHNIGMCKNGMRTSKACRGKYIALCEGDDYWTDPYKLQKQVDFLEANPQFVMCFHNTNVIFENGERQSCISNMNQKKHTTVKDLINGWYIMTCSLVFRNIIQPLPDFFGKVLNGDYALELILSCHGDIYYLDDKMGTYRRHNRSIGHTIGFQQIPLTYKIIDLLKKFNKYTNSKYKKEINYRISNLYADQARAYMKKENIVNHLKCIVLSIFFNYSNNIYKKRIIYFNYVWPVRKVVSVKNRIVRILKRL